MDGQRETCGRYCLPVHEDPPIAGHPAYRPASLAFFLVSAVMLASHHGIFHAGRGLQMAIDLIFAMAASGLAILMVWIRKDLRRATRPPERHAR